MEAYRERLKYFQKTLSTHEDDLIFADPIIDMPRFKEMCFYGIPDEPGLRQKAWKVLLGYLPPDKRKWPEILVQQRKTYYNWLKDLLVDPGEEPPDLLEDHPLNAAPSSKWATYFADNAILEQIDKDVRRTLPDFSFFQLPVPRSPLNPLSPIMQHDPNNSDHETDAQDGNSSPSAFNFASTTTSLRRTSVLISPLTANTLAPSTGPLSIQSQRFPRRISRDISPPPHYEILSSPIPTRRSLFKRIAHLNKDFGAREHQAGSYKAAKKRSKFHDALEIKVNALKKTQARKLSINGTLSPDPLSSSSSSSTPIKRAPPPPSLDLLSDDDSDAESDSETADLHWEAIERILFIYAKLNPGVGYVQGMNELLGPIYYLFATDTSAPDTQAHAEADSFFAFTLLMSDVRDHFVRSMDDDTRTGINASMRRVSDRLRWWDEELWTDLTEVKEVKEQYYVFRWITVLGTQEWSLPDVIRLWDSVIADRGRKGPMIAGSSGGPGTDDEEEAVGAERFEFFMDFCVAMVVCVRDQILAGDFSENIKLLQNYPIDDIAIVIQKAYEIRVVRAVEAAEAAAAAAALEAITESPLTDDPLSILGIPNLHTRSSSSLSSTAPPGSDDDDAAPPKPTLARRLFDSQEVKTVNWDALRKESLDEIFKGLRWRSGSAAAANANNGVGGGANGTRPGLDRKVSGGSVASNSSGLRPASVIVPPVPARWNPVVSLGPTTPTSASFGVDAARDWLFARKRHSIVAATQRKGVDEEVAAQAISALAAGGNVPVTEREQQVGAGTGFNTGYPGTLAWAGGLAATVREQPAGEETRAGRRDSVTSSTSNTSAQGGRFAGSLLGRVSKLLGGGGGGFEEEGDEVEKFAGYEGEFGGFVVSAGGRGGEKEEDEGGIPKSVVERYRSGVGTASASQYRGMI